MLLFSQINTGFSTDELYLQRLFCSFFKGYKICCIISYLVLKHFVFICNCHLTIASLTVLLFSKYYDYIFMIDRNRNVAEIVLTKHRQSFFFLPLFQILNKSFQIKCAVMPATINLLCHSSRSISSTRLIPIKEVLFSHCFIKFHFPI